MQARSKRPRHSFCMWLGLAALLVACQGAATPPATPAPTATATPLPPPPLRQMPIILDGQSLPPLLGAPPQAVTAWRFDESWTQVPVQVDERTTANAIDAKAAKQDNWVVYANGDWIADDDPMLDANDEVVLLAADASQQATTATAPDGVVAASQVEIMVQDPLAPASQGYLYLFAATSPLPTSPTPAANVRYTFQPADDPALLANLISAENSLIIAPDYTLHFSGRWIQDGLQITSGTGVDILDRHKAQFAPGDCRRSEDTFTQGDGGYILNKSGPIRAIRSYYGANSGRYTQRDHFFYADRHVVVTYLRVHPIDGIMDYYDYTAAASGMTYYNNLNPTGVTIDGQPDNVALGPLTWELVTGAQGSLFISHDMMTDLPDLVGNSYYEDNTLPAEVQCTGDAEAYGASGPRFPAFPCTDPTDPCARRAGAFHVTFIRTLAYGAPGATPEIARQWDVTMRTPLSISINLP